MLTQVTGSDALLSDGIFESISKINGIMLQGWKYSDIHTSLGHCFV